MRFVPSLAMSVDAKPSEVKVREVLAGLGDDWTCLHQVKYRVPPRLRRELGGKEWGEADFILLNPKVGVICLEVKGGVYLWDAGGLRKAQSKELIKPDPIEQGLKTKSFVVKEVIRSSGSSWVPFYVVAAFPDMVTFSGFGPKNFHLNIMDSNALNSSTSLDQWLSEFLTREEQDWRNPIDQREKVLKAIEDSLARTTRVMPLSAQITNIVLDESRATEQAFNLLFDQMAVLAEQAGHRRTLTTGAAGTGKSVLAVETARALASQGFRVLFFTPNNQQGLDVVNYLNRSGVLYLSNGLPDAESMGGVHVEYLPTRDRTYGAMSISSSDFANQMLQRFETPIFDALVVDESQDLTTELADVLRLLIVDDDGNGGEIHLFGDVNQRSVNENEAFDSKGFIQLALTQVCRNTAPIHRAAATLIPLVVKTPERDGPKPTFVRAETPDSAATAAVRILNRLIKKDGVSPKSIQVLVAARANPEWAKLALDDLRKKLRGFKPTPSLPVIIDNFKGLEAEIVLVLTPAGPLDDHTRRELYIAFTRAQAHLLLIGPSELSRLFDIPAIGSSTV